MALGAHSVLRWFHHRLSNAGRRRLRGASSPPEKHMGAIPLADYPGYFAARAVLAEEYAERAIWPSLADSYRRVAENRLTILPSLRLSPWKMRASHASASHSRCRTTARLFQAPRRRDQSAAVTLRRDSGVPTLGSSA